jgi:cyclopropane-fatty-acyl-phospholipid synthase
MSFPDSSLRAFLTLFSINRLSLSNQPMQKVLRRISRGLKRFQQHNPVSKAQQNVAHHYDLGNAFYKLFLDAGLFYSWPISAMNRRPWSRLSATSAG